MREPEDPTLRLALRKMSDALDRLAEVRAEVERAPLPLFDEPRAVDNSMMFDIASLPGASAELKTYALRVGAGECEWRDIEKLSLPVPREVDELKREPMLIWFPRLPDDNDEPYSIPWQ